MAENPEEKDGTPESEENKSLFESLKALPIGIGLAGLWLVILYAAFGTYVIFSLTAHQLQHSIKTLNADDKQLTVWQVVDAHEKWKVAIATLKEATPKLAKAREEKALAAAALASNEAEIKSQETIQSNNAARLNALVALAKLDDRLISQLALSHYKLPEPSADFPEEIQKKLTSNTTFVSSQENLWEAVAKLDQARKSEVELTKKLNAASADVQRHEAQVTVAREASENALKVNGGEVDNRIGDFLNSMSYLETKEAVPYLPEFSEMPPDMLTLILVLAMGALGGTIHLTQLYFSEREKDESDNDRRGAGYFLFRPFLGAVVALAVFILAKAGVLIVASPQSSADGANLSPFFVSFLGLVSGMLAEQAIRRIRSAGASWFGDAHSLGRERWAFGLKKAFTGSAADKKAAQTELADLLGVTNKELEAWMKEDKKVPSRYQVTIAAYARKPMREIFTDIKEPDLEEQPAE